MHGESLSRTVALRLDAYYDHSAPPPSPQPQVAQPSRADGDGSHVHAVFLCGRLRLPLMPIRWTHHRRRSPMAHSPAEPAGFTQTSGLLALQAHTRATLRLRPFPSFRGRPYLRTLHQGFLLVAIPVSGRRTLRSQWDGLQAPLVPLGFRRFLPPCPPPARLASGDVGTSPLLLRDQRVRRFSPHASWRTSFR